MNMYRQCMICNARYGCYNPDQHDCSNCDHSHCPRTRKATHGLCERCSREGMKVLE
jgi:hypothetical protein